MEKSTTKRFFLRLTHIPADLGIGGQFLLDQDEQIIFYQLTKVFRLSLGDRIVLINPYRPFAEEQNKEYHFRALSVDKKAIHLQLEEIRILEKYLRFPLSLALCLPNKPSKLDFILAKATELGVSKFYFIKSDLSQFNHRVRLDRLIKIAIEAAEQSEQVAPPSLTVIDNLDEYLQSPPEFDLVALERTTDSQSLLDIKLAAATRILIGPEGGFSDREVELIKHSQQKPINIGGHILKMDTAALLSVGVLALKLQ